MPKHDCGLVTQWALMPAATTLCFIAHARSVSDHRGVPAKATLVESAVALQEHCWVAFILCADHPQMARSKVGDWACKPPGPQARVWATLNRKR